MTELDGRVALVTGAGSGLGRATSRVLAAGGATVLPTDIDLRSAEETAELIRKDGGTAEPGRLDVGDREAVDRVIEAAAHRHGGAFDILVNNAGTDRGADLLDIEDEQWHGGFDLNLHGPMYLSRAFVKHRRGREATADIVCVASVGAPYAAAGAAAYDSSQGAHLTLAEVMQTEARERSWPVRVSAINPAAMATPMMDQWGLPPERMMDPEVVAGLIRFAVTLPHETYLQNAVIALRDEVYPG